MSDGEGPARAGKTGADAPGSPWRWLVGVALLVLCAGVAMLVAMPSIEERYERTWSVWVPRHTPNPARPVHEPREVPDGPIVEGEWSSVPAGWVGNTLALHRTRAWNWIDRVRFELRGSVGKSVWCFVACGEDRTCPGGVTWTRLLVDPAGSSGVVQAGSADVRCVGVWEIVVEDGATIRLRFEERGRIAGGSPPYHGTWGVRDDVLLLDAYTGPPDHVSLAFPAVLAADLASFRGRVGKTDAAVTGRKLAD